MLRVRHFHHLTLGVRNILDISDQANPVAFNAKAYVLFFIFYFFIVNLSCKVVSCWICYVYSTLPLPPSKIISTPYSLISCSSNGHIGTRCPYALTAS